MTTEELKAELPLYKEPKVKWRKSEAKKIVYNALMDGVIPLKDTSFKVMSLEDVYSIDPEFTLYDFKKFQGQGESDSKKDP